MATSASIIASKVDCTSGPSTSTVVAVCQRSAGHWSLTLAAE